PVKRGCTTIRSSLDRSRITSLARRQARTIVVPVTRRASVRADTSRNTSACRTCTRAIVLPVIARSKSRAIVSVSGSSGIAKPDIRAILLAVEAHAMHEVQTLRVRRAQRCPDASHAQHAPTGRDEMPTLIFRRAGMKHEHAVLG